MLSQLVQIHPSSFLPRESQRAAAEPERSLSLSTTFAPPKFQFQFQFRFQYCEPRSRARARAKRSGGCGCRCRSGNWNSEPLTESELHEGRRAVSTFLHELGVSEEDSLSIASNSPEYLKMLVEGVRDLDQHSMWGFDSDSDSGSDFSFKDKVLHIASHKGDNGKVAYLESLGFTLSSSINVARYLSTDSVTLPSLMHKVTCMKDLLFPGTNSDDLFIKNIRRMMLHLSIPIDDDLQHTLSFFEKVEARRGGLNMLSSKDAAFRYLIESFPRLLSLSVNNHMMRKMDLLENIGIPRFRIPSIILSFPPILLWSVQVFKIRVLALKEIDVVDEDYTKLLLQYPWVLSTSIQENYMEVLSFFDSEKVTKTCVDWAIKSQPHLLGCSTGKLKLMVDQLVDLGVKGKKLDKVIARSPQLLLRKPRDFLQVILFFESMGLDKEIIGRILARCPEIFAASIDKTLRRKIEFLCGCGVSETYLPAVIRKYPELLVSDTDRTLLHRLIYLMKLGLSGKDIAFMIQTFSPLLGYSIEEVLRPKIEFLLKSMQRPVRDVVHYPRYFSYSLEKKIKPRYFVLKGKHIECSLKDMLGKNDEEFAAEFMDVGRMLDPVPPLYSDDRL